MTEYGPVLNAVNSKQSCRQILQSNTSNKIMIGASQGIGNAILTTPLIAALTSMNMQVDLLLPENGMLNGAERIFAGMPNVKVLREDEIKDRKYLLGLQTIWPNPEVQKFVGQLRFAPNINNVWKAGISAHEVEINMSLAYSLKYEGEVPPLYCAYNEVDGGWGPLLKDKKNIGIHVCRRYNHQFHANRQLYNPFEIGRELRKKGHRVFIIGHEGSVLPEQEASNPEFVYCLGYPLEDVAGLIRELDCMVNEDSGIMHVTAAMDIPQLVLFGPTSDVKNAPWSEKATVARRDIECGPCQYTERAINCCSNICMDIDTSYVVQQVEELL